MSTWFAAMILQAVKTIPQTERMIPQPEEWLLGRRKVTFAYCKNDSSAGGMIPPPVRVIPAVERMIPAFEGGIFLFVKMILLSRISDDLSAREVIFSEQGKDFFGRARLINIFLRVGSNKNKQEITKWLDKDGGR